MNLRALDEFKFAAGINTDAVLVDDEALNKLIGDSRNRLAALITTWRHSGLTASTIWKLATDQ